LNKLDIFLKEMIEKVKNISDEEFKTNVDSVIIKLNEKDYNLQKDFNRMVAEINTHKYIFDR
jgi:secreted Zn-dependent insulinase-like peptidase